MPECQHPREAVRSHANHGKLRAVQQNSFAKDGRVAGELVPPEIRPEHHYGISPGNLIFVLAKPASEPWLHAEHVEIVTGNHHAALDARSCTGFGAEADRLHICVSHDAAITFRFVANVQIFAIREIVEWTIVRGAHQGD